MSLCKYINKGNGANTKKIMFYKYGSHVSEYVYKKLECGIRKCEKNNEKFREHCMIDWKVELKNVKKKMIEKFKEKNMRLKSGIRKCKKNIERKIWLIEK